MEEDAETADDITDYYGSIKIRKGENIMADNIVVESGEGAWLFKWT